ncbi:MarR family transcriptional regulator [Brucellaceae bacterium VT-16-1752]|nr:MarR family transcriptional regulator [Brucellaceae bacterium VT-16-1752]
MTELYTMPGHLFRRAQQISTSIFTDECDGFNLTSVQFAALYTIRANPGLDATRLSGLIAFDRSTIGDVLERLEAKKWIRRRSSPEDKRVKLVYLAPEGEKLLQAVEPAVQRVQERLLAPLPPESRELMLRLLTELVSLHNETSSS